MSTVEREVLDAVEAAHPAPSMALVPLTQDRAPLRAAAPASAKPANVHRIFFGTGYAGLALIMIGTWLGPRYENAMVGGYVIGAMAVGLGGLGVLVHVLYRPSMRKLRQGLGAVAALVLTVAAQRPVMHAALEAHASARIPELQQLADDLARDGRIRHLGIPLTGWVELNGFRGRLDGAHVDVTEESGPNPLPLAAILQRDGISRLELVRLTRRLREAGITRVSVGEAAVEFESDGAGSSMLYVRPGQPLPRPEVAFPGRPYLRTQPLGGGWYLLATGADD